MRIALATVGDPADVRLWAGTPFHLASALRSRDIEVGLLGPLSRPGRAPMKSLELGHNALRSRVYRWDREPYLMASYARQIHRRLRSLGQVDLILSLGALPVSHLPQSGPPVVIWTDATLSVMLEYYEAFTGWSKRAIRNARASESRALRSAGLFVATSEWARSAAVADYGLPAERTACVMYGANIDQEANPTPGAPTQGPARLLLVGVDWKRKGVDIAIDAVKLMRRDGIDVELDVVGAHPPDGVSVPSFVTLHGFLDKHQPDGNQQLTRLYRSASAFILPTQAECTAVVLCEAAAYGLPVIAPDTGGLRAIVDHGRTGLLVPEGSSATDYARAAAPLLREANVRARISAQARAEFEQRLNWPAAVDNLLHHVSRVGI